MNKYKVGDCVKVRNDLVVDRTYGDEFFDAAMIPSIGTVATIGLAHSSGVFELSGDDSNCYWTAEMFEGLADEQKAEFEPEAKKIKITLYFKNGATITVTCDAWEAKKSKSTGSFTQLSLTNPKPFVSLDLTELMAFTEEVCDENK